jgi:hypothetical protein
MDATTPSSSDPRELPTNSIEALPKAIRLALTELVDPTYRELKAGDWLFLEKRHLVDEKRDAVGRCPGSARISPRANSKSIENWTYSQRKNKRCLNGQG